MSFFNKKKSPLKDSKPFNDLILRHIPLPPLSDEQIGEFVKLMEGDDAASSSRAIDSSNVGFQVNFLRLLLLLGLGFSKILCPSSLKSWPHHWERG